MNIAKGEQHILHAQKIQRETLRRQNIGLCIFIPPHWFLSRTKDKNVIKLKAEHKVECCNITVRHPT